MSTRVDKGGPKFKPIIKPKARPSVTPAVQNDAVEERTVETHTRPVMIKEVPARSSSLKRTLKGKERESNADDARADANADADTDPYVDPDARAHPSSGSEPPLIKKRKRRQRTTATEPEGTLEPIDPTHVTMSAICDDLGSGRLSSRWELSQTHYAEARKRAREEREHAIAEAVENDRDTTRPGTRKSATRIKVSGVGENGTAAENTAENNDADPDEFTYNETVKTSHYAPQVRIGANGEVVLDMDSLQVDRAADPEIADQAYSFVEESDQTKFTNSNSWSKRKSVRWGREDTAMFYQALRQFGQNFDLIARVLPGRTYRMCKNKFKAEDKKNPALIDDALKNGVAIDLDTLSRLTGKNFSGPTPIIEFKKALNLEASVAAEELTTGEADMASNTTIESQMKRKGTSQMGETEDNMPGAGMAQRSFASPPPAESLLAPLNSTTQSTSPLRVEPLCSGVNSVTASSDA